MPSEHEKETAFLRRCIAYSQGAEGRQLDERIAQIQRDDRSLQRAMWLMGLMAALAVAGFGYLAVLLDDFPARMPEFAGQFVTKVVAALGIGSLISLTVFACLGVRCRRELNARRDECRRLVTNLLEQRLSDDGSRHHNGKPTEPETNAMRDGSTRSATDNLKPHPGR